MEASGKWSDAVVREVFSAVEGDVFWKGYLAKLSSQKEIQTSVHLAILREPYLDFILRGEKTVESRFSSRQCSPYKRVAAGDILVLKRQSGPVLGLCRVAHAWFYELDTESLENNSRRIRLLSYARKIPNLARPRWRIVRYADVHGSHNQVASNKLRRA